MSEAIHTLVARARCAQARIEHNSQDQVDLMVAAVGWALYQEPNALRCAEMAFRETGMGVPEDKCVKHRQKTLGVLRDMRGAKTVGVVEQDPARGLVKIAKPVGVIAAIMPVTNPTSTPACMALAALKTRNAVIVAGHPRARETTAFVVELMREGLRKAGAPMDLIQALPEPSREAVQQLMPEVDLVVATGACALVKAAYSSGTPAYGVGAGNACVVVDETADIDDAARKVARSKTFDNATSCSSENSLIVEASVWDSMIGALVRHGGHLCSAQDKARLRSVLWPDGRKLNPQMVAKPAAVLAGAAGLRAAGNTRFLMVMGEEPLDKDCFAGEKLSPVVTLWRYEGFGQAVDYVERLTRICGYGHSCGIHSRDEAHIQELAMKCHVSRMLVNQAQGFGNSGSFENGMPFSLTLGCGTWGGNITSENITWKHLLNMTWVSRPIPPEVPDEHAIFGEYWSPAGR